MVRSTESGGRQGGCRRGFGEGDEEKSDELKTPMTPGFMGFIPTTSDRTKRNPNAIALMTVAAVPSGAANSVATARLMPATICDASRNFALRRSRMSDRTCMVDPTRANAARAVNVHSVKGARKGDGGIQPPTLAATAQTTGTIATHSMMKTASLIRLRSLRACANARLMPNAAGQAPPTSQGRATSRTTAIAAPGTPQITSPFGSARDGVAQRRDQEVRRGVGDDESHTQQHHQWAKPSNFPAKTIGSPRNAHAPCCGGTTGCRLLGAHSYFLVESARAVPNLAVDHDCLAADARPSIGTTYGRHRYPTGADRT